MCIRDSPTDSSTLGRIQKFPKHLVEYVCDLPNKDSLKPVLPTDFKSLVLDEILHITDSELKRRFISNSPII